MPLYGHLNTAWCDPASATELEVKQTVLLALAPTSAELAAKYRKVNKLYWLPEGQLSFELLSACRTLLIVALTQVYGAGQQDLPAALVHAPLSVFPVSYPRASYEKSQAAMPVFNSLIDRISRDSEYLQQTLAPAAEFDDFTVCHLPASWPCPTCMFD